VSNQPDEHRVEAATRTLALLDAQAADLRAELARLHEELAQAKRDYCGQLGEQLREANERLVLTALRAETIAATAVSTLGELTHASQRDALTGTPNRALMLDRLENALAIARRCGGRVAVLFIDVDDFKQINDLLGHTVGDHALQVIAACLESVVRASDTVSRHSGDEFLVLLPGISNASDATAIAEKILAALAVRHRVGDHMLALSATLGIAIYPEDGEDADTLIRSADVAMYHSKRRRRGGFQFHADHLASDRDAAWSALDIQHALTPHASTDHEPVRRDLREANERLVVSAMAAHEMSENAAEAHRGQIKFLAMVAHELRNPLAPIRMAAELLNRVQADEPLLARLQGVITRQVTHLSRLVEDMLDGSRVSTGKFRLQRSNIAITDTLDLAIETCRPAMDARHQQLDVRLPSESMLVHGDATRLAQIFGNLLDNASKYTSENGAIALTAERRGDTVAIVISDNGIGISPEALPNVFDLFVQDPRAIALDNRGLGIGLAVVRELVEAHGGSVLGTSAGSDLGSEFVVTLPIVGGPSPLSPA
jgi:diguanylate cyclase (GGDEF)-like protein